MSESTSSQAVMFVEQISFSLKKAIENADKVSPLDLWTGNELTDVSLDATLDYSSNVATTRAEIFGPLFAIRGSTQYVATERGDLQTVCSVFEDTLHSLEDHADKPFWPKKAIEEVRQTLQALEDA